MEPAFRRTLFLLGGGDGGRAGEAPCELMDGLAAWHPASMFRGVVPQDLKTPK